MAFRIEVATKRDFVDVQGEKLKKRLIRDLSLNIREVRIVDVYTIDADLPRDVLELLVQDGLRDPVIQDAYLDKPCPMFGDFAIEVGLKPGVTDNVGRTAKEVIEAISGYKFKEGEGVYTSRIFMISGDLKYDDLERIATGVLVNDLIQRYTIKDKASYERERGMGLFIPKPKAHMDFLYESFSLEMPLEDWVRISKERTWALNEEELKAIISYFRDPAVKKQRVEMGLPEDPVDVEIEAIAQTWSEHCKHKIMNSKIRYEEDGKSITISSLFRTFIVSATERVRRKKGKNDICLSVFTDNAGIVSFNRKYNLSIKVETHNTPSALDPYGGALTGIVGVNRDPLGAGLGSRLIFNIDVFCFAPPDYSGPIPPRLFHPKRVLEGVREGVEHGGNKSGIPTVNGSVVFHEGFLGKPLVFCGTCGIMPKRIKGKPSHLKGAKKGDVIVMVGGRIGKDGIHGATFSSEELSETSPTSAVQIGDPITQKRMIDFLLTARDRGLYNSITDCGAGGLSSSVGEMARDTNGCLIELEKPPLKYEGLYPWEILLSEAQERMTLSCPKSKLDELLSLAKRMNVEATAIGEFTDSGKFHCTYKGKTVAYIDMDFLHNGLPQMVLDAKWERSIRLENPPPETKDFAQALLQVLSRWNVCSKEYFVRQYDHEVQGSTVLKPLVGTYDDGPTDASVIRPDPESRKALVVSHGICPKLSIFDTYHMAACAITEAVSNNISVGGSLKRMVLLDNFCWPDPIESEKNKDGKFKLAQLVRASKALYDLASFYGTPFVSGKDSMKNDYIYGDIKISVPPTILVTALSIIDDAQKIQSLDFKEEGSLIVVVGVTFAELGGSEYFGSLGLTGNFPPRVRPKLAKTIFSRIERAIRDGILLSCHDVSDGGIGCAISECAFSGDLGAEIDLSRIPAVDIFRDDFLLFSESYARFIVTVRESDLGRLKALLKGVPFGIVGRVTKEKRLLIRGLKNKVIIDLPLEDLREAWKSPFMTHFSHGPQSMISSP